ncbi:MAG: hypothetical protein ACI8SE_001646 [Bacteroidia bacterium]|jgi:hypothetical protein
MSLRYIKHIDIDKQRWDKTIADSNNPRIYAESWYLDVTTNNCWDAVILNDYEAVMPLPYNRKLFGVHQIYRPFFTQQLGVFSTDSTIDISAFIQTIPKKFLRLQYPFHSKNDVEGATKRTNLVLPLSLPYSQLQANFSASLRKRIRRSNTLQLEETADISAVIQFYKDQLEHKVKLGDVGYRIAQKLFSEAYRHKSAKIYRLLDDGEVLAMGVFLVKYNRVINVFGASANSKTHPNTMSALLSKVMEKYAESNNTFDFEGSDLPGIKDYFLSFGSKEENYSTFHYNRLPVWLKWFRPD